jgi:PRTRC genetic system protein B
VLVASHGILAWHRAAHPAPLWFSMRDGKGKPDRKHPLSRLSGSKFPMPPLLWMVKDKRIYLWAMKEDARPTAKTKLHPTPFWNSYPQTGGVCQGTMAALPENPVPDAAAIARIEAAFFQSNFTHGPIGVKRTPGITTHADLWRHARKARRFPTELLHKPITTLANILK